MLITGASGFIGGFLVDEALARGYRVTVTVRPTSRLERLRGKPVRMVKADFSDARGLETLFNSLPRFECVIHNAGATRAVHPGEFYEVNQGNTRRLLAALATVDRIPGKFIFISSLAACGPGGPRSGKPVNRLPGVRPVSHYGRSKLAAEKEVQISGMPWLIFRPTAVYGPGDRDFLQTIRLIAKGIDLQVGRGRQDLSFLYVKDLARLVLDAVESPVAGKCYCVSDGRTYGPACLGASVSRCLGKPARHISVPLFAAMTIAFLSASLARLTRRPSLLGIGKIRELAAANWICDTGPLAADFGFCPRYDLETGMQETLAWYREMGWL